MHKSTTDKGATQAGTRERPKLKPQAYITRDKYGNYEAKTEDGCPVTIAENYQDCHIICKQLGYVPNRNKYGDAPKTTLPPLPHGKEVNHENHP